jgi:signal transduction histidine kinase
MNQPDSAVGIVPCSDPDCPKRRDTEARCWAEPMVHCHRPLGSLSFGNLFRHSCRQCQILSSLRGRARGRRRADHLAVNVLDRLGHEMDDTWQTLSDTTSRLNHTLDEQSVVAEVMRALSASRDRTEIVRFLLAGITSGEGFGLNRAFLFLSEGQELAGFDAVGPIDSREASRLYADPDGGEPGLADVLDRGGASGLTEEIRKVRVRWSDKEHSLVRAALTGQPHIHRVETDGLLDGIPGSPIVSLAVPLAGRDGPLGLLLADNLYTGPEPTSEDLERIASLALQATMALERAGLHDRLGERALQLRGVFRVLGDTMDQMDQAESLASLGEIATQVLHGLKNSLVVISGHARGLLRTQDRPPTDERAIRAIHGEATHLEWIVATLLAQGGKQSAAPEPIDPAEITCRAVALERGAFERCEVELVAAVSEDLPSVVADADQLLMVMRKILQNARDATPPGGRVRIRTRPTDSRILFEVADTGPGMPDERKVQACEAFFTTKREGTGLGLWLAQRVLVRHGGEVSFSDSDEGGLTVTLELPIFTGRP